MIYQPPPPIIYKYADPNTADLILSTNTLWFSSPMDFNDPFDCHQALIDFSVGKEGIIETVNRLFPNANRSERREKIRYFNKHLDELSDAFIRSNEALRSEVGVCCFSRDYKNILMWSHYTDKHQGLCIGFNIKAFGDNYFIQEVNYPEKITPKKFFSEKRIEALNYLVLTKSHYWKYEEEVRAISYDLKGKVRIQPVCVQSLCFGLKSDELFKQKILNILRDRYRHIEIYSEMELDEDNFGLKESEPKRI